MEVGGQEGGELLLNGYGVSVLQDQKRYGDRRLKTKHTANTAYVYNKGCMLFFSLESMAEQGKKSREKKLVCQDQAGPVRLVPWGVMRLDRAVRAT